MHSNKRPLEEEARLESRSSKKPKSAPILEEIINSPGLQHIAEEIILNLDYYDIMTCKLVNNSCKDIVNKPMFWLKKWKSRGLSKENYKDWVNAIQIANNRTTKWSRNGTLEKKIQDYIEMIIKIGHFVDVPCFIDGKIVSEFAYGFSFDQAFKKNNAGILQLLAVENIEKITNYYIISAAGTNHLDLMKVLAPLLKNPNSPIHPNALTAIHAAAWKGHANIIKYLAPLTENPNAQETLFGKTPIYMAAKNGNLECIKALVPFCKNINTPLYRENVLGLSFLSEQTPIEAAKSNGHDEIARFLQSYLE